MSANRNCLRCGAEYVVPPGGNKRKYCGDGCARAAVRERGPERFWAKVEKTDSCWLYMGFRKWDGYGWVARSQGNNKFRWMTAHRYAWILTHGEPPEGMHILHKCDNPPCCNPAHLSLGTHQDNMRDAISKGRGVRGERNRRSKLTHAQAMEVRALKSQRTYKRGEAQELADKLGVRVGTIHAIWRGDAWADPTYAAPLHPDRIKPRRATGWLTLTMYIAFTRPASRLCRTRL